MSHAAARRVPVLTRTRDEYAVARAGLPGPVVLVPTMGALHHGHRALLRRAREIAGPDGSVVVSVFVNPLQFGPGEDFGSYPRTLGRDRAVCAEEGVAVVFAPGPATRCTRPSRWSRWIPARWASSWRAAPGPASSAAC